MRVVRADFLARGTSVSSAMTLIFVPIALRLVKLGRADIVRYTPCSASSQELMLVRIGSI